MPAPHPVSSTPPQSGGTHTYVGRFAPSPTAPLHFGSLVAALGGFLDARSQTGRWLLRIEDIDTPRNVAGASDAIARDLDRLGLHWDGSVSYQSANVVRHRELIGDLLASGAAYRCGCSRKEIGPGAYPGTCRSGLPAGKAPRSVRMLTGADTHGFVDLIQGSYRQDLEEEVGDFVILRADDIVAYHLAVVADDAAAGVTNIVRGADLLDSTPSQLQLYAALNQPAPRYAHLPVATNKLGQKLSKQTRARAISMSSASELLWAALTFLGHPPPEDLHTADARSLLEWAVENWQIAKVPVRTAITWS